jgi:hypothetical protein
MTATSVVTTKQQPIFDHVEATKSDDEAQVIAATSVVTTKQQPIFDLVEATKSDDEAKAAAATSEATTNQEANLELMEAAKSDGEAKAITTTSVATPSLQANFDLLEAAESDDEAEAVAALTQSGVDVNYRENFKFRFTPLLRAVQSDSIKVAWVLLADPRVEVNAADTMGLTALHRAQSRCLSVIILSQRTDIDWNVVDKAGRTPLLHFARLTRVGLISELIRVKSVQLLARSIDGFTALHELAERESPFPDWFVNRPIPEESCKLIDVLFAELEVRGHNLVTFVNATDILNRTALHYIAEEGSVEMLNRRNVEPLVGKVPYRYECHYC